MTIFLCVFGARMLVLYMRNVITLHGINNVKNSFVNFSLANYWVKTQYSCRLCSFVISSARIE